MCRIHSEHFECAELYFVDVDDKVFIRESIIKTIFLVHVSRFKLLNIKIRFINFKEVSLQPRNSAQNQGFCFAPFHNCRQIECGHIEVVM